jgi:RNA polymerase sigma factor (TIGR02999 family)
MTREGEDLVKDGQEPAHASERITRLLAAWNRGETGALESLMPLVHGELKRVARRHMARERPDHTLQPTALVNEAYLRLAREHRMQWRSRAHFVAVAAQLMRFILVDHARRRGLARRGAGLHRVTMHSGLDVPDPRSISVLAIDDALADLGRQDPRKARVAELRLFAGATVEESAAVLGVSAVTIMRDWRMAKAWLQRELARGRA